MRLGKYLAHAGVASRRAAEAIIGEGRVTVADKQVLDPAFDVDQHSGVAVDGRLLAGPEQHVVYALNKPLGVLSTAHDPYNRPTVVSLVKHDSLRLYPVGRLDADSSGLILLTNDGELAHRLTHPRFHVPKTYRVRVAGEAVRERALHELRSGVLLEDGMSEPARVTQLAHNELMVTIHEGRNRQVRRMCEAVGHPVRELERVAFGSLELGKLAPGDHRRLANGEVNALRQDAL